MSDGGEQQQAQGIEAVAVESALTRGYPALASLLGRAEVARLARQFLLCHPFCRAGSDPLDEILPEFLAVALEEDTQRGAWLPELARLEEALVRAGDDPRAGTQLLSFEHRVDELLDELLAGAAWEPPRPTELLLAIEGAQGRPRRRELSPEQWQQRAASPTPPAALPRRATRGASRG